METSNSDLTLTLEQLREIKDRLPHGAIDAIAEKLNIPPEQIRAFFRGESSPNADPRCHLRVEKAPNATIIAPESDEIIKAAIHFTGEG